MSTSRSVFSGDVLTVTARLARLSVSPALQQELPGIIAFVDELRAFKGKKVESVLARPAVGRADEARPAGWPPAAAPTLIEMAPAKRAGFIEVKHVFS